MIETKRGTSRAPFVAAILAGSFLLFLVQPMVARMALPRLGGAPAVWNSAMLVYQALLLGGYAYAHWLGRLAPRTQGYVHLAVLVLAMYWLPLGLLQMQLPVDAQPAVWVPWLLAASIGPLFFAISAQAPLLQRWFSVSSDGSDPYALYAASNLGSFGGLIAYPLLVEPSLALDGQRLLWSGGYVLVVMLVAVCVFMVPKQAAAEAPTARSSEAPPRSRVLLWIALAFVPSGLMLATSTYITTDIVAMPLLWVMPLGLYLLSFTVAFAANRALADILTRIAPVTILLFGGVMIGGYQEKPYQNAGLALVLLFMASVALHTAMYRLRPAADRLTGFYLAMSVGGALGGVFAALVSPLVFDWTYEYPLLILASGALVPQGFLIDPIRRLWAGTAQRQRIMTLVIALVMALLLAFVMHRAAVSSEDAMPAPGFVFLAIVVAGLLVMGQRAAFVVVLAGALMLFGGYRSLQISFQPDARVRSYFGVYTVNSDRKVRQLAHGTTVHGTQLIGSEARERTPTTYYVHGSGVGQAMLALPELYGPTARVGVVGLGSGTLACYARPDQYWRFYEIDPAMVRIARDTGQFTFLKHCLPDPRIVIGDARLNLQATRAASLDLLTLDAFSSDSVPMHLMTQEAFATYARVLAPRGVLLVHISNRFLDLEPVVSSAAVAGGWSAAKLVYIPDAGGRALAETASVWLALSRDPETIAVLRRRSAHWEPVPRYPHFTPWSDDYSTILPLMKAFQ
ncbi:fused MFS/spermidine synthase [Sphingomonas endolithica]|uniref:fused MFS/spermidine synthase n=1 Tax=Sphingomonas endolithica TaxID=2972485 RepID=UPI0021B067F0|nr:fused MFS/spermidine synthase [Sphingomonas sp. ZFBP2030]